MAEQQSSRSKQLLELGRIGMESLIREPVRESVREALVEERLSTEEQEEHARRRDDEEQTGNRNRLLRPVLLLPVLGLAAAVGILRRRRLMELAEEKGAIDQIDEALSTQDTDQRTAADSEPTGVVDSTDYGGSDDASSDKPPTSPGNFDDGTGTEESKDYEEDDTDGSEIPTLE